MGHTLVQAPQVGNAAPVPPKQYRFAQIAAPAADDSTVFKLEPATPDNPIDLSGVAQQFGTGAAKGVINFAATPAFIREAVAGGLGMGAEVLGASPETAESLRKATRGGMSVIPGFGGPTGDWVIEEVNKATRPGPATLSDIVTGVKGKGLLEQEPTNVAEEYAGTAGEFLPGVVGPGGPVRKAVQWLFPAFLSETAGQATKGTDAEPWFRLGFGVAGGLATAGNRAGVTRQITRQLAKDAPTAIEVNARTRQLYDRLRGAGIRYDANAFHGMALDLGDKLRGFRAKQAPLSADVLDYVKKYVGYSPDFTDFDSIRQSAGKILRESSASNADKEAAGIIIETLDDFSARSPMMTNGKIDPREVNPLMKEAREHARRNIINRDIDEMVRQAEVDQSGFDNGIRRQFSNYLQRKGKHLTLEEYQAFADVSNGVATANAVKGLANFGFNFGNLASKASVLPTIATAGAAASAGMIPAGLLMGAGTLARYASPRIHRALAKRAQGIVSAGIPAQRASRELTQGELEAMLLRRILAGGSAVQASGAPALPTPTK